MRLTMKQGAITEESREFCSGYRAGIKAAQITNDHDKAHYLIGLPKYIENNPDDMAHSVYGMGFDYALNLKGIALK